MQPRGAFGRPVLLRLVSLNHQVNSVTECFPRCRSEILGNGSQV